MPSHKIIRSLLFMAAFIGVSAAGASAQAGIIVTVGRPCPDFMMPRKPTPDQRAQMQQAAENQDTCLMMPDGQIRCAKTIRIETINALPPDWRCIQVSKSVLYCETPSFGASPGAAGAGEFDPLDEEFVDDDGELETLGCDGGAGAGGLAGLGGLIAIAVASRRRRLS